MVAYFCHVSEYGEAGFGHLPLLAMASRTTTLWSPSSVLFERFAKRNSGALDKKQFIELIESGAFRIAGRSEWFDAEQRARHAWPGARWDPYLDGEIKRLLDTGFAGIVVTYPETGDDVAQEVLSAGGSDRRFVAAQFIHRQGLHPIGTKERILRKGDLADEALAMAEVIRDAENHAKALEETGMDGHYHLGPFPIAPFAAISPHNGKGITSFDATIERGEAAQTLVDLIDYLSRKDTSLFDCINFVRANPREQAILQAAFRSPDPAAYVRRSIEEGTKISGPSYDGVIPVASEAGTACGLIMLIASFAKATGRYMKGKTELRVRESKVSLWEEFKVARRSFIAGSVLTGVSTLGSPTVRSVLEHSELAPLSDYTGSEWPFMIANGAPPSIDDLPVMIEILRKFEET